ncbi:MAG: hypothetical protein ACO3SP_09705 [Ilumatobacteraceae bacterium]
MPSPVIPGFSAMLPVDALAPGAEIGGVRVVPNGGLVFKVRGNGTSPTFYDNYPNQFSTGGATDVLYPSIASALLMCKAGRGDYIHVLPGHTESVATAAAWTFVSDVTIVGIGSGNRRPTVTFTAATATLTPNAANVFIENIRFKCGGTGTGGLVVAAPFTITGEGTTFSQCSFELGADNSNKCTDFCNVNADNVTFAYCDITSTVQATAPTSCITLTGANGFRFYNNRVKTALSSASVGVIRNTTTASGSIRILDNDLQQWKSDSTSCISFAANSATTGEIKRNLCRLMTDGSVAPITLSGTGVDMSLLDNFVVNNANERGLVVGTASA